MDISDSPPTIGQRRGHRLRRGADRKFVTNPLEDDQTIPEFIDGEAASTSRSSGTETSGSEEDSSDGEEEGSEDSQT